MPTIQRHEFLQKWYADFKKQVYEKAQIDMTQKADLGRLKNYTPTNWTLSNLFEAEGELMYACIPHEGVAYKNPPPDIVPPENPEQELGIDEPSPRMEEYLQWTQDNLQVPESDEEIERLYNMSREGTLMAIEPGFGYHVIRQVYTNEKGEISVSVRAKDLQPEFKKNVPEEYRIPPQPREFPEMPDPKEFGLTPPPQPPTAPKNMKPGFWSWVGYKLWMNTDYAKKERYKKDLATYNTKYGEWQKKQPEAYSRYEKATEEVMREKTEYFKEAEEYFKKPLGKLFAILISIGYQIFTKEKDLGWNPNKRPAQHVFRLREAEFMKKQHADLPQGKINEALEETQKILKSTKHTRNAVENLLSHDASVDAMEEWTMRRVFKPSTYELEKFSLPTLPENYKATKARRSEFDKIWKNLFQVASFAALSHADILGKELHDGKELSNAFTADERAKLNYTMILQNLFTEGRGNSDEYMQFLDPAREKANDAIQAYHRGDVGPMADLLRGAIRKTNQQAASLSVLNSDHAMNTLYLIGRMWEVVEADPELQAKVGLTVEEIEETKGNIAIHSVMTKGFQAKEKLLMHALYQRTLTPQELKDCSADLMLAQQVEKRVYLENDEATAQIEASEEYKEVEELMEQGDDNTKLCTLHYELIKRPGFEVGKDLLKENWIESAKAVLREQCRLDRISTMTPDEIGKVVSSPSEFEKTFKLQAPKQEAPKMENEIAPVKNNEIQQNILG